MYIAFKWLVFLALIQWMAMCVIHTFVKENKKIHNTDIDISVSIDNYLNKSVELKLLPVSSEVSTKGVRYNKVENRSTAGLQFFTFIAGALAVMAYQKKQDLIVFTYRNVPTVKMLIQKLLLHLKIAATKFSVAIIIYAVYIREKINNAFTKIRNKINSWKKTPITKCNKIHSNLLKKLKEMAEERKSLGQLLISALRENKNIRMRYELETMTKNRLMQHIEDTQKQVKENRSRYVSFHQSYLLTQQENIYLKARLVKLRQEKEETEKDLMGLINEVYMSKNKDLKTYCTRFLVKTKNNLLNSDVRAEIKKFLENSRKSSEIRLTQKNQVTNAVMPSTTSIRITELVSEDECLIPFATDAPKLRGLPGEYVWTVKDKDGIIEKIYEYDYEPVLDSGDTIRRIRQYSVYFDKDCLIDFSRTEHRTKSVNSISRLSNKMFGQSLGSQKIVTGSEAFQNFLKSRSNIVQLKPSAVPLMY